MTKTSTFRNHFSGIQNSVIIIFNIYWIGFTCITWARVGKKRVHKAFSTSVTCSHHLDRNGQPWRRCSQTLALARTASPESIFFFFLPFIHFFWDFFDYFLIKSLPPWKAAWPPPCGQAQCGVGLISLPSWCTVNEHPKVHTSSSLEAPLTHIEDPNFACSGRRYSCPASGHGTSFLHFWTLLCVCQGQS